MFTALNNFKLVSMLKTLFKLLFSLGIIVWLVSTGKLPLAELKTLLDPRVIGWGLVVVALNLIFASERWRYLLKTQGFHVRFVDTLKMTLVGVFFSHLLPGGVGGDVVKAYYVLQRTDERRGMAVGTVVFDRLIGLFTMVLMAFATSCLEFEILSKHPALRTFALLLGLLFAAFLAVFWLMWSRRTVKLREKLLVMTTGIRVLHSPLHRLNQFQLRKGQFTRVVFLSFISQCCSLLFFIATAQLLGFDGIPLSTFLFCVPMGVMATAIPISPGGIGVGQAAFFYLFNLVMGVETQVGPLLITAFQAFLLFYGLIGAVIYIFLKGKASLPSPAHAE